MWPQYAFWLATGITDIVNGHTAPNTTTIFPEYSHGEDQNSTYYFKQSIKLLDMALEGTKTTAALDRNYVAGSLLVGGKALENAYVICKSNDYQELDAAWKYRESKRDIHKGYLTGGRRPWLEKKKGAERVCQTNCVTGFRHSAVSGTRSSPNINWKLCNAGFQ